MISLTPGRVQGALLAAFVIAALASRRIEARTNLALHRPVSISSVLLGDPAQAVNGVVEWGSYAVHSRGVGRATFTIDLGEPVALGEVRIYGRGDGYYENPDKPMAVELSRDGKAFAHVVVCDRITTQVEPCRAEVGGFPARYVRVTHPGHLVLSEVEVYAAR